MTGAEWNNVWMMIIDAVAWTLTVLLIVAFHAILIWAVARVTIMFRDEDRTDKDEVAQPRRALEIATITMAAVWPEDFRAVFSDAELLAMGRRHEPPNGTDFRVEDVMRAALAEKEEEE